MTDLDDVWRDDELVETLAGREPVDVADPAARCLRALTGLVDATPVPGYDMRGVRDLDNVVLLDEDRRSRRVAVRSLAVALTAVATLSTSGVAAVVTGDPFQPAKVVWQQIQQRAGERWGADPADETRLDSAAGMGGVETSAQAAVLEAARQPGEPSRLLRVGLARHAGGGEDGSGAAQSPSQGGAVTGAEATDEPQATEPPPVRHETTTGEGRQPRREEQAGGTRSSGESTQQREATQTSEQEQDTRSSDQPDDEQEPISPTDDLDPVAVPDGPDDDPGEESEESAEQDVDEGDEGTATEPAHGEDTASTEDSAPEESAPEESGGQESAAQEPEGEEAEGEEPLADVEVEPRAGGTGVTVAPPGADL